MGILILFFFIIFGPNSCLISMSNYIQRMSIKALVLQPKPKPLHQTK